MIGILLVSSTFLIVILIAVLLLAFNVKRWAEVKEDENKKRFDELKARIDETQNLFKNQVTELITNFKNLLK